MVGGQKRTKYNPVIFECFINPLTAVFFETGAMPVPTKSQNPTVWG